MNFLRGQENMKKLLILVMCIVGITAILSGCSAPALPEGLDEEAIYARAEQVVANISKGDYEGTAAMFSPEMAAALDAAGLEKAIGGMVTKLGSFEKITAKSAAGKNDATIGDYAVVIIAAKYENGRATYTISIDKEGQIIGLYMK
jgi:hypothetical protein